MMIKQKRILFDLSDIVELELVCNNILNDDGERCHQKVTLSLDVDHELPDSCPFCRKMWPVGRERFPGAEIVRQIKVLRTGNPIVTLQFHIDDLD